MSAEREPREIPPQLAYTEAQAATVLHLKGPRSLMEMRYRGDLKRGVHYARIGKTVLYSNVHLSRVAQFGTAAIQVPPSPSRPPVIIDIALLAVPSKPRINRPAKNFRPGRTSMETAYRTIYTKAVSNAGRRAMPFDLTWIEMLDLIAEANGKCVLTGITFTIEKGGTVRRPFAPSLDRIDSSKGYTLSNCRIVCCAANLAMNEWGEALLRFMAHSLIATDQAKDIDFPKFKSEEYGLEGIM